MDHLAVADDLHPQTAGSQRLQSRDPPGHHAADEQDIDVASTHGPDRLVVPSFEQRAVPAGHMGEGSTERFDHLAVGLVVVPHLERTAQHRQVPRSLGPPCAIDPERFGLHRHVAIRHASRRGVAEVADPELIACATTRPPPTGPASRELRLEHGVEAVALETVDQHPPLVLEDP